MSTLPRPDLPQFTTKIPSTGKEVKYRPFLVKEEKILLLALEDGRWDNIMTATTQILQNCLQEEVNIDKLTSFDVEWLFLQIRSKSIGETTTLRFRHTKNKNRSGEECKHIQEVVVDLTDVECIGDPAPGKIEISDTMGMQMSYPTYKQTQKINVNSGKGIDQIIDTVAGCVDYIYDAENIYYAKDSTPKDIKEFLEQLNKIQFSKIQEFFVNIPKLQKEITYTCERCGETTVHKVKGLQSFFG